MIAWAIRPRFCEQILSKPDEIPRQLLNRARCVLVFPSVKKVAVGVGGTYGRGVILCRTGANMTGPWSAPAMYKLNVGTLGVQLGSSSTDYVLLVQTKVGAEKILSGKLKLGAECSAVAGPTGAKALGANDRTSTSLPTRGRRVDCSQALRWLAQVWIRMMTPTSRCMANRSQRRRSFVKEP